MLNSGQCETHSWESLHSEMIERLFEQFNNNNDNDYDYDSVDV